MLRDSDFEGAQPIHITVSSRHAELVKLLLAHDVDANSSWRRSRPHLSNIFTPVVLLFNSERTEHSSIPQTFNKTCFNIASLLVAHGADVTGVADHFTLDHVLQMDGFDQLWD